MIFHKLKPRGYYDLTQYRATSPMFSDYTSPKMYEADEVKYLVPMTAKEVLEDTENQHFKDALELIEEKLDGKRATLHMYYDEFSYSRVFGRSKSVVTEWLSEDTDRLPHLRDLIFDEEWAGTIIDGELRIPGYEFKEVSSTLNCLVEEAISRQLEYGHVVLNAFDIMYYKGECVENLPLIKRKELLHEVIEMLQSPYVIEHPYYEGICEVQELTDKDGQRLLKDITERSEHSQYVTLFREINAQRKHTEEIGTYNLTRKAFYEYIVLTGGEGVMIKDRNGVYEEDKRTRAYQKIKKTMTVDAFIMGFTPPTKEYKGKFQDPQIWRYWEDEDEVLWDTSIEEDLKYVEDNVVNCKPVSKYFAENWVGTMRFGVIITKDEIKKLPKKKKFVVEDFVFNGVDVKVVEIGECSGYDEDVRKYLSDNPDSHIGETVEIKCNGIFDDTGKLRHPRFVRFRPDKLNTDCTWREHIDR